MARRMRAQSYSMRSTAFAAAVSPRIGAGERLSYARRYSVHRRHCRRHFPVLQVAKATYREILERRAAENQIDFVRGVATALTPFAYFEVVMNKAFRSLVDDRTEVSVETGLRAAEKLQSVLDGRDWGTEVLELKVQLGNISKAVRSVVPQSMWAAIVEELEELEQHSEALAVGAASFDDAGDEPFDPTEFIDEDDELWQ
jgi:hypothetical protein